jgi:pimeloyl-ACP methyl ester carboxylesterase
MLNPKFVQFKTSDNLILPGLLFEVQTSKEVAIFLHGNGSSSVFYFDDYSLAKELNKKGISLLMFNNRGAHIIKKFNVESNGVVERKRFGMAYENIKESIFDIEGAVAFLEKQGYKNFHLIGTSTGANKICVFNYYRPKNNVSKYVLVSGGDDTGIYYSMLGKSKFQKILELSKKKIQEGKGEEIICDLLPDDVLSYKAFWDMCNPDGDYNIFPYTEVIERIKLSTKKLFRHFKSIRKSTMIIYGENDEYVPWGTEKIYKILKDYQPNFTYKIIQATDHQYSGKIPVLAKLIAHWLISH